MTRRGWFFACVVLAALLAGVVVPSTVGAARLDAPQSPPPRAFIVVDARTGTILLADHEHDALPPASTAKVMTALTAVEQLPPAATIDVSALAAGQPASRINMAAGQQWPFEHAMASMMMASANDAAYAIAETAGGSLDGFIAAQDETAERLGMRDSTFADPAGLDDDIWSYKGGPRMSAYDIAIATRNAMTVPEIAKFAGLRSYEFDDPTGLPRSLTNHNKLLPGGTRAYRWATGFKTGFTERAGHTIAATATRDGRALIAVILNTYDTYGWAAQLFEQAFAIPNRAGTGDELPAVAVSPYGRRVADQRAFTALALGPAPDVPQGDTGETAADPTTTTTTATSGPPDATAGAPEVTAGAVDGDPVAASEPVGDAGGGGWLSLRNVAIVLVVLLVLFVALRRRAVRRQRARRIALQRARAAKMRSGALTVVDGRYRTGQRTGPPVDSHIRVRREGD